MFRYILAALLSRIQNFKRFGMYAAVVLFAFALIIPIMGRGNSIRPDNGAAQPANGITSEPHPQETPNMNDRSAGAEDIPAPQIEPQDAPAPAASPEPEPSAVPAPPAPETARENDPAQQSGAGAVEPAAADISNMVWPLKGDILQEVGIVYSKTFSDYRYHNGVDLKAARGAEVAAALPGKVASMETSRSEAKKIVIDHGSGWQAVYSHLEEVYVKPGSVVKAGQSVGHVGQPGLSEVLEGPHLHFTLLEKGKVLNPLDYLPR